MCRVLFFAGAIDAIINQIKGGRFNLKSTGKEVMKQKKNIIFLTRFNIYCFRRFADSGQTTRVSARRQRDDERVGNVAPQPQTKGQFQNGSRGRSAVNETERCKKTTRRPETGRLFLDTTMRVFLFLRPSSSLSSHRISFPIVFCTYNLGENKNKK